jgi:site-specific DNA-methyltransferase (adenine-specific)
LVRTLCRHGGLVLDPFCGFGTSLVTAIEDNRSFLGIELERGHYSAACQRVRYRTD